MCAENVNMHVRSDWKSGKQNSSLQVSLENCTNCGVERETFPQEACQVKPGNCLWLGFENSKIGF